VITTKPLPGKYEKQENRTTREERRETDTRTKKGLGSLDLETIDDRTGVGGAARLGFEAEPV
jgi:hypothetical protein